MFNAVMNASVSAPFLGCIADDFTGATDLANNLVRAGMRVVQTIGVPDAPLEGAADAIVVALKSRTIPAAEAVAQSLAALKWLQAQGTRQTYFKYCSTFDSTAKGNIGPVTDALMDALGTDFTIACPAFPENGRTVFKGYLFVGDELLHESGMRNHPLTPMTDSNLVRVLQAQTARRVGLIDHRTVAAGAAAIETRIAALRAEGVSMAVVRRDQQRRPDADGPRLRHTPARDGGLRRRDRPCAKFQAGRTRRRGAIAACTWRVRNRLGQLLDRDERAGRGLHRARRCGLRGRSDAYRRRHRRGRPRRSRGPPRRQTPARCLVYATASPESVRAVQAELGVTRAGEMVEHTLATVARGLVQRGVGQLIVAGGETSGACVQSLGIDTLRIGPQIAPGVPWCPRGLAAREGPWPAHRAEVRQLRRCRFLHTGLHGHRRMNETALRDEICRVGASLFERGYVHATAGNISVRLPAIRRRRLSHHTDRCVPWVFSNPIALRASTTRACN